ncbi:MAG: hypothetical protein JNG86_23315 [Verrucomicrobiaceae bacterium]|nr:hypothetical protein [Verrucomicrobiaceae bacterium]
MESKFWIFIGAITLIAGAFSAVQYFQGIDRINADLQETKSKITQMNRAIELQKAEWTKIETLYQKQLATEARLAPLQQQKTELEKKFRTLEGEFKYLVNSTRSLVDKVRANGPGEVYPELKLSDGRTMKDAKVRKVEENQLSLIHSEGFATIQFDLLPSEVRERFDMGGSGLANMLETAEKELFEPVSAGGKSKAAGTAASRIPATGQVTWNKTSSSSGDSAAVKQIKSKIIGVEAKMQTASNAITALEQQIADYSSKADDAKSRGTPASRFTAAIQAANQQISAQRAQLVALEAEKKNLQLELGKAD